MAHSRKKVILRTIRDEVYAGYLPASGFVSGGAIELLDLTGRIVTVAADETRMVAYVRDFNLGEEHPEQLTRRAFLARPRTEGLWVSLMLENGEPLEGLAALDAALLDGLLEDSGLFLAPPDVRCNTQRVFIPRSAIAEFQVLGVVTNPSKMKVSARVQSAELPFPRG